MALLQAPRANNLTERQITTVQEWAIEAALKFAF